MATLDDILKELQEIKNSGKISGGATNNSSYAPSSIYYGNDEQAEEKSFEDRKKRIELETARRRGDYLEERRIIEEIQQANINAYEEKIKSLEKESKEIEKQIKLLEKKNDLEEEESKKLEELKKRLEEIPGEKKQAEHNRELSILQHQVNTMGQNKFTALTKTVSEFSDKMVKAYKSIRNFVEPWAKADDAASKFTKTLGGTKAAMDRLRKDTLDSVATGIGVKFNMSTEELLKVQQDYLKGIGRNISIDDNSRESMAAIARISQDAGVDGLGFAAQLENFGISMDKTGDHMGKMFAEASKSGISFQKYSDNVVKNIKLAQNYTFKNGIKGLESMAKKATALKIDMQQVANLADKVSTVEGALETSAKLQVLGGPFASMADPMGMLYEGLNDMEGLQDRIIKMVGGLGNFNKETGEVEVSAFNKQRIKAAAAAMGMDYGQLMESVNTQAKRGEIEKQIGSSVVASKFDDDMKELIMNTGVIKDGKVGVNVNGKFKTLDEIKKGDRDILQQQTQSESEDIKQIAMDLRSLVYKEQGLKKQADAIQAEIASPFGQLLKWVHGIFDVALVAVGILGAIKGIKAIGAVGGAVTNIGSAVKTFGKTGSSSGGFMSNIFGKKTNLPSGTRLNSKGRLIDEKTGRFVSTKATPKTTKATQAIDNSGKGVLGRGLGRAGKRGLIKVFGRKGATKVLGAFGKKAATTALSSAASTGASAIGGLLSGGGTAAGGAALYYLGNHLDKKTEAAVAEGRIEKGGTKHTLSKTGTSAIKGAGIGLGAAGAAGMVSAGATMLGASALATSIGSALGAIGGPIGMAIGAAVVGGVVGLVKSAKAKNEVIVDNQLKDLGIERKGNYGSGKLKKIDKALQTGELSNRMRRKLIQKGDIDIVKAIDKKKEEKEAKELKKKEIKAQSRKMNIRNAIINIGHANFSKRGFGLSKINPLDSSIPGISIKGVKETGFGKKIATFDKAKSRTYEERNNNNSLRDFNININGSLKLTGDNGQSIDIISELRHHQDLLRSLTSIISKEMGYQINAGYFDNTLA